MSSFTCVICGCGMLTNRTNPDACIRCENERPEEVKSYRASEVQKSAIAHLHKRLLEADQIISLTASIETIGDGVQATKRAREYQKKWEI